MTAPKFREINKRYIRLGTAPEIAESLRIDAVKAGMNISEFITALYCQHRGIDSRDFGLEPLPGPRKPVPNLPGRRSPAATPAG